MKKTILLALFVLMGVGFVTAQTRVTGKVTSADDGSPLPFVTVTVKGTSAVATTGDNGAYAIDVPAGGETLVFSFIGMNTQEVEIKNRSIIDVMLENEATTLDDVLVIGYGTAKKESFTGSAVKIKGDEIQKRTVGNVTKALEGLSSGVQTSSGGGQPGSTSNVRIRGIGSINASSAPLYVVDGAPYDGTIASINPNDIESMTVLKDASAGAIYGSRGANGVIVITTKRGKEGRTNINYKGSVGFSNRSLERYDLVGMDDFVSLTYETYYNDYYYGSGYTKDAAHNQAGTDMKKLFGGSEFYNPYKNYTWGTLIDPATGAIRPDAKAAWNENWMDELTNENAVRQEHNLNITGGNEKTLFSLSAGYLDEDGILKTASFSRVSFRGSVDHQAKSWARVGISSSYANTKTNESPNSATQTANSWYTAQFMSPIYPFYLKDDNGNDVLDADGNKQYDWGTNRHKGANFHSLGLLELNKNEMVRDNIGLNTYVQLGGDGEEMGIFKGLRFKINYILNQIHYRRTNRSNAEYGDAAGSNGTMDKYATKTNSYTLNQLLTYNRRFNKHAFDLVLGHEYYDYKYEYLYGERSGIFEGLDELNPAVNVLSADSYTHLYRIDSYLTRFNYSFMDRYYFDASWRTDGSSRFHKDHRWGNFWSVGASWRISEENFMKNISWLNNMTLKFSLGDLGNDNLLNSNGTTNYYAWQSFYDLAYANANMPGAMITSLENKRVSWEKKRAINTGFEASLLNNRLQLSFEYFNNKTSDMLLNATMALSTGFTGYSDNMGDMRNQGIEFMASGLLLDYSNFKWNATLMVTHEKNEVLKLTGDLDRLPQSGSYLTKVGWAINTYYMPKYAGVDPATGDLLYWVYDTDPNNPDARLNERISSDPNEAVNSRYEFGSRQPDLYGSIRSDFTIYKNFDLSVLGIFSVGGKILDGLYANAMNPLYIGDAMSSHLLRRWRQPGDITDVPRLGNSSVQYERTDRNLVNASFFAIKNITLGYSLPKSLTSKINIQNVRVFCTLDNYFMFNHLDGMDPQYNFSGGVDYTYAPIKTWSIGLDINF